MLIWPIVMAVCDALGYNSDFFYSNVDFRVCDDCWCCAWPCLYEFGGLVLGFGRLAYVAILCVLNCVVDCCAICSMKLGFEMQVVLFLLYVHMVRWIFCPLLVVCAGIYNSRLGLRVCWERRESGGLGRRIRTCCLLQMRVRMKWSVTACVLGLGWLFGYGQNKTKRKMETKTNNKEIKY